MERRLLAVGVATLALVLGCVQAASASASDASSTQSYLQANYALLKVAQRNIRASEAAYKAVQRQVTQECPQGAAKSPQDTQSTQLSNEIIGAMVLSAAKPDLPAINAYLRKVSSLHWSNGSVSHAIAGYVGMLRTLSKLGVPHLCSDVTSWAASGFQTLPSSTVSFVRSFLPNWVALGVLPPSLSPLESTAGKALARRSRAIEIQITDVEARAVATWGDIMDELILLP